jgi:hypothetical protein
MKVTFYEADVASLGDAARKGAAILAEACAERVDAWEAAHDQGAFPAGWAEVVISLSHDGERCPVALHMVLMVRLVPVSEIDTPAAEGG